MRTRATETFLAAYKRLAATEKRSRKPASSDGQMTAGKRVPAGMQRIFRLHSMAARSRFTGTVAKVV